MVEGSKEPAGGQRGHRVRVGLTGIAAVLVVVAAVAAVIDTVRDEPAAGDPANVAVANVAAPATGEPLAEIGVLPSGDTANVAAPVPDAPEIAPELDPAPVEIPDLDEPAPR